jgi:hypothetical protein
VDYLAHNEEIKRALHSIYVDLRKLKNDIFDIEIHDEINVAPMRRYIEEWFQRRMDNLIDEGKQLVGTIPVVVDDKNKNEDRLHSNSILITYFFLYQSSYSTSLNRNL